MTDVERKRLALHEEAIRELNEIANDPRIRRDNKLTLMRGTLNELRDALRRLEERYI